MFIQTIQITLKQQTMNNKPRTTNYKQQTMNHKLFLLSLLLAVACQNNYSPELKSALQLAGSNRQELKSVLSHYGRDRADSLKFRAACFLIENHAVALREEGSSGF